MLIVAAEVGADDFPGCPSRTVAAGPTCDTRYPPICASATVGLLADRRA
jgi:hypothetical protein